MGKNATPATPRFNLSIQTLRVAYEALRDVPKRNAQTTFIAAQAMAEIEAVLAALPAPTPEPAPAEDAQPEPAPKRGRKGRK